MRWEKVLKVTATNTKKGCLLVFFSIVMGYILSSFFIESLYQLWQEALEDYYKIKSKETTMEKLWFQSGDDNRLVSVTIEGKNAVLPLLAATILASKG